MTSDTLLLICGPELRSEHESAPPLRDDAVDRMRRTLFALGPVQKLGLFRLGLVTSDPEVQEIAAQHGVVRIDADRAAGLPDGIEIAAAVAERAGFRRLCILSSPARTPSLRDLRRLLATDAPVTVCPTPNHGTAALLLAPPRAIRFHDAPRSAIQHLRAAGAAGLRAAMIPLESMTGRSGTRAAPPVEPGVRPGRTASSSCA